MSKKMITTPKRQLTFIVDLNKCIGCQTCTVACKKLWSTAPGQEFMYWRNVETTPGLGYPKNWQSKGGGYKNGMLQDNGHRPTLDEYGVPFKYDFAARLFEGKKGGVVPSPEPRWSPNWDEEQGMVNTQTIYSHFCHACVITARIQRAWKPVQLTLFMCVPRMG